jgi:hypothetical protein
MWLSAMVLSTLFMAPGPAPDEKSVDFDPSTDFSQIKTFVVGKGVLKSPKPELNSDIVRKKIQDAFRSELTKRGLQEQAPGSQADILVAWHFGSADKREVEAWPVGRWGGGTRYTTSHFSEGTLVIDLLRLPARELLWRGIYRDDETNPSKISSNLPKDIQKLFDKYPSPPVKK